MRKILVFYLVISCLIFGPALGRGFIFLLDMPWAPMIQLSDYTKYGLQPHLPIIVVLRIFNTFIPGWVLQKLLLLSILVGIGVAVYLATYSLIAKLKLKLTAKENTWVSIYAGTLALLNPFVYERLLAGQWLVLSGYGYIAFLTWLYLKFGATRKFWLAYILFPIFSVHIWMIASCITILGLVVVQLMYKSITIPWFKFLKLVGSFAVINCFWFIPTLLGNNDLVSAVSTADFTIFKTASDRQVGVLGNVINLYGFWQPVNNMKDEYLLWFCYGLLLFSLTLYTLAKIRTRTVESKKIAVFGLVSLGLGVLFSAGYGSAPTSFILSWMQHIPGAATLRDTAKVISIVAICISVLSPIGIVFLAQKYAWHLSRLVAIGFITTTIMMSGMLFGLGGNLTASDYPQGWYAANDILEKKDTLLILPWQGYLNVNFANNRYMANPAEVFFDANILVSSSTGNLSLDNKDDQVEKILNKAIDKSVAIQILQENIQPSLTHVMIIKTGNWHRYDPIVSANQAYIMFEDSSIIVLRLPDK